MLDVLYNCSVPWTRDQGWGLESHLWEEWEARVGFHEDKISWSGSSTWQESLVERSLQWVAIVSRGTEHIDWHGGQAPGHSLLCWILTCFRIPDCELAPEFFSWSDAHYQHSWYHAGEQLPAERHGKSSWLLLRTSVWSGGPEGSGTHVCAVCVRPCEFLSCLGGQQRFQGPPLSFRFLLSLLSLCLFPFPPSLYRKLNPGPCISLANVLPLSFILGVFQELWFLVGEAAYRHNKLLCWWWLVMLRQLKLVWKLAVILLLWQIIYALICTTRLT